MFYVFTHILDLTEVLRANEDMPEIYQIVDGAIAHWVERATPGQEVMSSILPRHPSALDGSISVQCDRSRQKSWSPCSVSVLQHVKLPVVSFGTSPRDSLVVDEDVKKSTKQINKVLYSYSHLLFLLSKRGAR